MLCKLGAELGLTPPARTRIHVEPQHSKSNETAKRIFRTQKEKMAPIAAPSVLTNAPLLANGRLYLALI
jgi:hypothetical protein